MVWSQPCEPTMDPGLSKLIREYNEAVADAVNALFSVWVLEDRPKSNMEWACTVFRPGYGPLPGGIWFFKHGFGCQVKLPGRPIVDFDFGEQGEIDGIEPQFLYDYMREANIDIGVESLEALKDLLEKAHADGDLVISEYLYYLPR